MARQQNEVNQHLMTLLLKQNERMEQLMAASIGKGKGPGRGKRSVPAVPVQVPETSGIMGSLRSVLSRGSAPQLPSQMDDDNQSTSSGASFAVIPEDGEREEVQQNEPLNADPIPTTESIWVTSLELQLNGTNIDQLESKMTKDQAMNDYNRLFLTSGLANSLQTNFISYPLFLGGCYISAWDLSTSNFVGNSYALPNIKTGV